MSPYVTDLSIVVEWENAGRIGFGRAFAMLGQLHHQLLARSTVHIEQVEILLVFAGGVDETLLKAAVERHGRWPAVIRYLACDAAGYYEQKNYGAEQACGEIIVFLDSDVVPEPGWLDALLSPFASSDAQIVAGATSVELSGRYSTAMALGWIFPLPPANGAEEASAGQFYANNVAFRRGMIEAMRFPRTRQYRVQVGVVQRRLAASSTRFVSSPAAAVLHPPPGGISGFATRALWCGYDTASDLPRGASLVWRAPRIFAGQALAALRRVWQQRRRADLGLIGAAAASGVIGAYQSIRVVGFVGGVLAPRATWRWLNRIAP